MPSPSTEDRLAGFVLLAVTSIGWAINWVAIKILLREWPPLFSRGVSGVAAAVLLGGVALVFRESLRVPRWAIFPLLLASFTNVFAWMGFSTMAMKYLDVSEGTLLLSFQVSRGNSAAPKSVTPSRIDENMKVVELSAEELEALADISRSKGVTRYVCPPMVALMGGLGFPDQTKTKATTTTK